MSIEPFYMLKLQRAEGQLLQEIRAEQVTHVTEQYGPGSERLERLYEAIALAHRFTFPSSMEPNV
jgi:hypothetical protein